MPNKLHFYTHYSKEKIKLSDKPLASGGEGALYAIASPRSYKHLVAKIYYPDKRDQERIQKMHYLRQHPPIDLEDGMRSSIAWVYDLLYKEQNFVGIIMPLVKGQKLTQLTLSKLPRRAPKAWQRFAFGQKDALKLRLKTCFNIAVALHQVHRSNRYVLVDLKPDNIMMEPNGLITLVDMDSVEVFEDHQLLFPAPVATPEYTPPEHYHDKRTIIESSWDHFSMGIIFYQLLFGLHPFTASAKAPYDHLVSLHEKIQHHLYVHNSEKQHFFQVIPPPHKRFHQAPESLQLLFQQCFDMGSRNPESRPTAEDWCMVLADLLNFPFKAKPNPKLPLIPKHKLPFSATNIQSVLNAIPTFSNEILPFLDLQQHQQLSSKAPLLHQQVHNQYKSQLNGNKNLHLFGGIAFLMSLFFLVFASILYSSNGQFNIHVFAIPLLIMLLSVYGIIQQSKTTMERLAQQLLGVPVHSLLQKLNDIHQQSKDHFETLENLGNQLSPDYRMIYENQEAELFRYKMRRVQLEEEARELKSQLQQANNYLLQLQKEEERTLRQHLIKNAPNIQQHRLEFLHLLAQHEAGMHRHFHNYAHLVDQLRQELNVPNDHAAVRQEKLEELAKNRKERLQHIEQKQTNALEQYLQQSQRNLQRKKKEFKRKLQQQQSKVSPKEILKNKEKALRQQFEKDQQALKKPLEQQLQNIKDQFNIHAPKALQQWNALIEQLSKEDDYQIAFYQTKKLLKQFKQTLKTLAIDDTSSNIILKKLNAFDPKAKVPKEQLTTYTSIADAQQEMIAQRKQVDKHLATVQKEWQRIIKEPALLRNPIDLSYWMHEFSNALNDLEPQLAAHLTKQEQFFMHSSLFDFKSQMQDYQIEKASVQGKLEKLENNFDVALKRLQKKYTPKPNRKTPEEAFKAYEAELAQQLNKKIQAQAAELETLAKEERQQFLKECANQKQQIEQHFEQEQKSAKQKKLHLKKLLKELHVLHEQHQQKVHTIQKAHDDKTVQIQISFKQKAQKIIQELEVSLNQLKKGANQLHEKHQALKDYRKHIKQYQDTLQEYRTCQNQKIKLEFLQEWEQEYDTKIFIQDLLGNKVTPFVSKKNNTNTKG